VVVVGAIAVAISLVAAAFLAVPAQPSRHVAPRVTLTSAQLPRGWMEYASYTGRTEQLSQPACRQSTAYLFGRTYTSAFYVGGRASLFEVVGRARASTRAAMFADLQRANRLRERCARASSVPARLATPCVPLAFAIGAAMARDNSAFVPLQSELPTNPVFDPMGATGRHGQVSAQVQVSRQQSSFAATYLSHGRFALVIAITAGEPSAAPPVFGLALQRLQRL